MNNDGEPNLFRLSLGDNLNNWVKKKAIIVLSFISYAINAHLYDLMGQIHLNVNSFKKM